MRASSLLLLAVACGNSHSQPDAKIHLIDSSMIDTPASCTASATYGTPTLTQQSAINKPMGSASPHGELYDGLLNSDALPDVLDIELYAGFGAFAGSDISNQTITLTGAETSYKDCGACVLVLTNVANNGSGAETDDYMATAGTLMLTSTTGTLSGTLTNATLAHVMIGSDGTTTVDGSCATTITSASFTATLAAGSAAFTTERPSVGLHHRFR